MDINSLEPNSHKYRQQKASTDVNEAPKRRVERVVSTPGVIKKKGLGRRFIDDFFNGNVKDVKAYLIYDVLIPSIKETINSLINKGTEMILFGESSRPSSNRKATASGTYISYGSTFRSDRERLPSSARNRLVRKFDDIEFKSRAAAEEALDILTELMDVYHQVTVSDLYDTAQISHEWTEDVEGYGWTDISNVRIIPTREGYVLDMPKCVKL